MVAADRRGGWRARLRASSVTWIGIVFVVLSMAVVIRWWPLVAQLALLLNEAPAETVEAAEP
jgi:hypothetical protein